MVRGTLFNPVLLMQTARFILRLRVALKVSNWDDVVNILASSDDTDIATKYVGEEIADAQAAWRNANALEQLMSGVCVPVIASMCMCMYVCVRGPRVCVYVCQRCHARRVGLRSRRRAPYL